MGRTVEKILLDQTQRNHKEQHITQSLLLGGNGWTVENTLKTNKERNHKERSTSLNPA
jgi:hypothetical protein